MLIISSQVIKGNPSQYVRLNVGGCLHHTTIGTLTKQDNMLKAMFSGRMEVLTDSEGESVYVLLCLQMLDLYVSHQNG